MQPPGDGSLAGAPALAEAATIGATGDRRAHLTRGATLGRYVILEHLASGGMGAVYRAYDPDLDRAIAIKLVHVEPVDPAESAGARARILREAHALARLSHPNVVAVYDVGSVEPDVFIAMELVEGETLRAWLRAPRPREAILRVLRDAGRGLAAAHAAGIVHRDVKPENLLVGDDGRVRIVDFGLAGGVAPGVATPDLRALVGLAGATTTPLTAGSALLGTPTYMAPEQFTGRPVDARADQFAFCVTAYEALYGERPFDGDSVPALAAHVCDGIRRPVPEGRDVPARIGDAILRGLDPDPERRHPTMAALLAALEPAPPPRRRAWIAGAAAAAVIAGVGVGTIAWLATPERTCAGARDRLAGAWDDAVRARVGAAFRASGHPHAEAALARFAGAVDGWADGWVAMRVEACRATRVRGEQSPQLLDLRIACLDRRRDELAALTRALGDGADDAAVDRAPEALAELAPVHACADAAALLAAAPRPRDPAVLAEVRAIEAIIDQAHALAALGDVAEARARAGAAVDRAAALGLARTRAEALLARGAIEEVAGDYDAADATVGEAAVAAGEANDDALLAEAMIKLLWLASSKRLDLPAADAYGRAATALIARTSSPRLRGRYLSAYASMLENRGEFAAARDHFERALPPLEQALGPDHLTIASVHNSLAHAHGNLGDLAASTASYRRALAIHERALGPDHPDVAASLNNLALAVRAQGRYDEAAELVRRALAIAEARQPDHPHVAFALNTLGLLRSDRGDHAAALPAFERAIALLRGRLGPGHPDEADVLNGLGFALRALGRAADAQATHEEALAIYERTLGPDHPRTIDTLVSLGLALGQRGALDDADAIYRRALAAYERTLGPDSPRIAVLLANLGDLASDRGAPAEAIAHCARALHLDEGILGARHPDLAYDLICLGRAHGALGRWPDAIAALERAVALRAAAAGDPAELATARFALAAALWDGGGDRARARDLAVAARADLEPGSAAERRVAAWLDAR